MPAATTDFAPRSIGERVIFSLDFALNLASGETITAATWTCTLQQGTDPGAAARISGGATFAGSVVQQLVDFTSGMSSGARYLLQCAATTSLGEVLIGFAHVTVTAPS
jgi:hypothetical protein